MKKTNLNRINASGGLVCRIRNNAIQLLLIYRNGVWDLPKGKVEEDESIPNCAVREVAEEVGLTSFPTILSELDTTFHTYVREGIKFEKTTYWFVMKMAGETETLSPQKNEGITNLSWQSISGAKQNVGYENLVEIITLFENHQDNLSHRYFN